MRRRAQNANVLHARHIRWHGTAIRYRNQIGNTPSQRPGISSDENKTYGGEV
jgi:hypothetical protein